MRFFALVFHDIKSRFSGSRLSILWALASPAVTVGIYWFVYTFALRGSLVDGVPYLHFLIAGILPWFFFAEGLSLSASVYRDYGFLVRNIPFPLNQLPLMRTVGALLLHLLLLLISFVVLTFTGVTARLGQTWVLFWMAGGFLLTLGLGRIFALLNVRCKDVGYGLSVALQLGFWLTPVFWSTDALPLWANAVVNCSPVAILISGYRNALLFGASPDLLDCLIFWGFALVVYTISLWMTKRMLPTLSDGA